MASDGRRKWSLDGVVNMAVLLTCLCVIWTFLARPSSQARVTTAVLPAAPLSLDGLAVRGASRARVAVIEYADFQCPFCATFVADVDQALDKRYVQAGLVKWAFVNMPLSIHPQAQSLAEAAECARRQGAFWPMRSLLFKSQAQSDRLGAASLASSLHLDMPIFTSCIDDPQTGDVIRTYVDTARAAGVTSTPTFMFGVVEEGGRVRIKARVVGAKRLAEFERIIDGLL